MARRSAFARVFSRCAASSRAVSWRANSCRAAACSAFSRRSASSRSVSCRTASRCAASSRAVFSRAAFSATGVGSTGAGGTMNSGSLACSMAITLGNGLAGGGETAGMLAGAALLGGELTFAVGVIGARVAVVGCAAAGSGVLSATGSAATVGSITPDGAGAGAGAGGGGGGVMAGFATATGSRASTTRRSGTSTRRACQGKAKPGSPNSSPPKVRLNSNA
ncbi:MAG: hypothetical protein FD131_1092 [Rhodocyclaceae bacterium]|nr:MAG: hypothetical protein FD131_1092 [Rhodocyclaceae bacterium]